MKVEEGDAVEEPWDGEGEYYAGTGTPLSLTHTLSLRHTHSLSDTLSVTLSHTISLTHSLTQTLSLSPSPNSKR